MQARMGSSRFPGKSLFELQGKPALLHLLESLLQAFDRSIIQIATSTSVQDDKIAEFCQSHEFNCFRGDENNVASRFLALVLKFRPRYFVRLNGDSPLLDFRLVRKALSLAHRKKPDLLSTKLDVPYPSGMNVEVIKASIFSREYKSFSKPEDFEHVTPYFYRNPAKFKMLALKCPVADSQSYKFSFDSEDDYRRLKELLMVMRKPHYSYGFAKKCSLYKKLFLDRLE